jgi:hypothetical protein
VHRPLVLPPPVRLREWRPVLPAGDLRTIWLHWTGGDYAAVFPAYHFCLSGADEVVIHQTHDLRANMRDVRAAPDLPYAAHTSGRNAWGIGLAICAMAGAAPNDFGVAPLTEPQLAALCTVAARLAAAYGIANAAIRTHAEAALEDGYFGDGDEQRWDIARLAPAASPLVPADALRVGAELRARIAAA